jgi:hypothetical protein
VYLDSDTAPSRVAQLEELIKIKPTAYSYFAGDWNFTLDTEDSSSPGSKHSALF